MDSKATGELIAQLRKEHNMTQKQLAEELAVTDKAISRWETGKGYPDIPSLLALSERFSVSVNELLYGRKIRSNEIEKISEINMVAVLNASAESRKRAQRVVVLLTVITLVAVWVLLLFSAFTFGGGLYHSMMGSENCVVASDYSYITYYGEKYVPLPTDDLMCEQGVELVREAKVEDVPFAGKLLFGESVYAVAGCASNDLIYLQTDYDLLETRYYCKESRYEFYRGLAEAWTPAGYYAVFYAVSSEGKKELDGGLAEALCSLTAADISDNVNCAYSTAAGDDRISVIAYDENGIFYRELGEILRKSGEYYWFDYDDVPADFPNGDFSCIAAYIIDDEYDAFLDAYFSYNCR